MEIPQKNIQKIQHFFINVGPAPVNKIPYSSKKS